MIDSERLGALLRAWVREDTLMQRERTLPVAALRALARTGPEAPHVELPQTYAARVAPGALSAAGETAVAPNDSSPATADSGARAAPVAGRNALPVATRHATSAAGAGVPTRVADAPGGGPLAAVSAQLALSPAGRLIRSALVAGRDATSGAAGTDAGAAAGHASGAPSQRTGVQGSRPLVAVPPHSEYATDRLALQLKDAVEYSGVFYESHVAQWVDDRRPRALLAREPQSGWAPESRTLAADATGAPTAPPRALVAEQLAVLDSGRFVWQGELWPGQRGTMEIDEERGRGDAHEQGAPAASGGCRLRLTLDFPGLGAVDARLALHGDELTLALACARAGSVGPLRHAVPALRQAIAGRSLDLQALSVTHEPAG
jgi:hypothetical protein